MRILLIEDDTLLAKATAIGLNQRNFSVDVAHHLKTAWHFYETLDYEMILLDLQLPDGEGTLFLQELRRKRTPTPVIVLTARDQIKDRIALLEMGADDFVVKPYDLDEISARIHAVIRRIQGRADNTITYQDIYINTSTLQITKNKIPVLLTSKEFQTLVYFMQHQGQVLSRQQLEDALYQHSEDVMSNAIEVHIHNIRRKLGKQLIRTVYAAGYTIDKPAV